jgi:hypothetical protein
LNKEIKRRTRVVGILPNDAAIIHLVGALLLEQQEEWRLEVRRVFSEPSMAKLDSSNDPGQDQHSAGPAAAASQRPDSDHVTGLGIYTTPRDAASHPAAEARSAATENAVDILHQRCTLRRIAKEVGAPLSTVGRVIEVLGLGRLRNLESKPPVQR